jgi:hypothetical protein
MAASAADWFQYAQHPSCSTPLSGVWKQTALGLPLAPPELLELPDPLELPPLFPSPPDDDEEHAGATTANTTTTERPSQTSFMRVG